MSSAPYTIVPGSGGGAVDSYTLTLSGGTTATIPNAPLSGTLTLTPGTTTQVRTTAINAAGSVLSDSVDVISPAAPPPPPVGPNDLTMSGDTYGPGAYGAKALIGGKGFRTLTVPPSWRLCISYVAGTPPPNDYAWVGGFVGSVAGMMVRGSGQFAFITGGNQSTGVQICDGATHEIVMQGGAADGSMQSWVDGALASYADKTPTTLSDLLITATGATAPNIFFGDRAGWGTISEVALFNTAPYATFANTIPVRGAPHTLDEPGLVYLWRLHDSGAVATT